MDLLTIQRDNHLYAPGIATYGIDGSEGKRGSDGNCIYYTDYNIDTAGAIRINDANSEYSLFKGCIKANKMLQKNNKNKQMIRGYKTGDYIVTSNGYIYEITNIDKLLSEDNQTDEDSFKLVGHINPTDTTEDVFFQKLEETSRLYMASQYDGLDINKGSETTDISKNYGLRIIGDYESADENKHTNLLSLISTYSGNTPSYFNIYYDNINNSFVIDSNRPICIDAQSVKFKSTDIEQVDQYSSILLRENSLTQYINKFQKYSCTYYIQRNYKNVEGLESVEGSNGTSVQITNRQVLESTSYILTLSNNGSAVNFPTNTTNIIYFTDGSMSKLTKTSSRQIFDKEPLKLGIINMVEINLFAVHDEESDIDNVI